MNETKKKIKKTEKKGKKKVNKNQKNKISKPLDSINANKFSKPLSQLFDSQDASTVIEIQKIGRNKPEVYQKSIENEADSEFPEYREKILFIFDRIVSDKLKYGNGPSKNFFFNSIYLAYGLHGELILSPDDYWLAIQQQFGMYVEKNSKKLQKKIVDFDGKMELEIIFDICNPDFKDINSSSFRWDLFTDKFSSLIQENTKGMFGKMCLCNFSTTTAIEKCVSEIMLMQACQNYFDYTMYGIKCGISRVNLLGRLEDWNQIINKLESMKLFVEENEKMLNWIKKLKEITSKFIDTYNGKPDVKFWNSVIEKTKMNDKIQSGSGYKTVSVEALGGGWIKDFFIYDSQGKCILENSQMLYKHIPASYVKVPVKLKYENDPKEYDLEYLAGFTSVRIDDKYRVRPNISVAFALRD